MLTNPSFDGGTHRKSGEMGVEYPNGWDLGWLDHENGPRHRPQGHECLKPEVEVISFQPPYTDPPRVMNGTGKAVKGFKLYGTLCWWLYQQVPATAGNLYRFTAHAHAWAHADGDPDAGHWTHGVGDQPYFALETDAGLTDDEQNYRFRVGIHPLGGDDPWDELVVWGTGAHIYNAFAQIPPVEAMAQADSITVFIMVDCLWGLLNSDAYIDVASLEPIGAAQPGECRGAPREQYVRTYYLLPPSAGPEWVTAILQVRAADRPTVGWSADDAGVGDLDSRTVVAINPHLWPDGLTKAWYDEHYPGVEFVTVEAATPDELVLILSGAVSPPSASAASKLTVHVLQYGAGTEEVIQAYGGESDGS